jgi:hypothetical protein
MHLMSTYVIIPNGDGSGFNVGIAGSDGARQTMLGFASEAEAEAWIMQDKRLDQIPAPHSSNVTAVAQG